MTNDSSGGNVFEPLLDLLAYVDVILDVFQRRILRKILENLLHLLFG